MHVHIHVTGHSTHVAPNWSEQLYVYSHVIGMEAHLHLGYRSHPANQSYVVPCHIVSWYIYWYTDKLIHGQNVEYWAAQSLATHRTFAAGDISSLIHSIDLWNSTKPLNPTDYLLGVQRQRQMQCHCIWLSSAVKYLLMSQKQCFTKPVATRRHSAWVEHSTTLAVVHSLSEFRGYEYNVYSRWKKYCKVTKKFSEWKQVYVGMEPSKSSQTRCGNDTTTHLHHPYILCHLHNLEIA